MPITVIDSFEHLLPILPMKVKDREDKRNDREKKKFPAQYHTVKESSISTRRAIPIAGYIKQDAGSLMLLARAKIDKVKNIDEFMPGVEKTHLLANEADVLRASAQHLVYPINMLLPELFPGVNLRIVCNSEVSETDESRFDMRWLLDMPGKTVTAAILEYKTTRALHRTEFELGEFDVSGADRAMKKARPRTTYFKGNAAPICRNKFT